MKTSMIKVLSVRVGKPPEICEMSNDLRTMQEYVGGYIETFPLDSLEDSLQFGAIAVLNEEGKLTRGIKPNRKVYYQGSVFDTFYGDFFVCGCNGEGDFISITPEQETYYKLMFTRLGNVA